MMSFRLFRDGFMTYFNVAATFLEMRTVCKSSIIDESGARCKAHGMRSEHQSDNRFKAVYAGGGGVYLTVFVILLVKRCLFDVSRIIVFQFNGIIYYFRRKL